MASFGHWKEEKTEEVYFLMQLRNKFKKIRKISSYARQNCNNTL